MVDKWHRKFVGAIRLYTADCSPLPRWYLPLYRPDHMDGYYCYHFLVAPFVLAFLLLRSAFRTIWGDLIGTLRDLERFRKVKGGEKESWKKGGEGE